MNSLETVIPENRLTTQEFRDWIVELEKKMSKHSSAVDRHSKDSGFDLRHTFTDGLYTREIFMPKGAMIISRIHLFEHPFIVSQGKVSVYDGESIVTLTSPYQGVTKAGTKRVLYVHEDTVWTTFHVTEKKTFEEIDKNRVITCDSFDEFNSIINKEISL